MNPFFASLGTTIFEVMSGLARQHDAINLGQGFPDEPAGPDEIKRIADEELVKGYNQYPPMLGLPVLRQAIAAHEQRFYGLEVDWQTETMVTSGATEALAASILSIVQPGDEVVLVQPLYDAYAPLVHMAGGVAKLITLTAPDWEMTDALLDAAFTPKTRAIVLNDPTNPIGRVFSAAELDRIAAHVIAADAIAIVDGVWEHVLFDGATHIPLITRPGMRDRTVKIGSVGKTLSLCGWKVGTITAAPEILRSLGKAHQFLTFTTPPGLQVAAAAGLALPDSYFTRMSADLQAGRDLLTRRLRDGGFVVLDTKSTFFLSVDLAASGIGLADHDFAMRAVAEAKVASIPYSSFYQTDAPTHLLRLCFSKRAETLDAAADRLIAYREQLIAAGEASAAA